MPVSKSRSVIEMLSKARDTQSAKAGTTILEEGATGKLMYVIKSGKVEVRHAGKVLDTLDDGDIFGEISLLEENYLRSASAVALTDCELVPIDQKRFEFLVQQTPFFAVELMRIMADRLLRMNRLATEK